jgi:GxxExxY protein
MYRRDAETLRENKLTEFIIGACIEVHKVLGPGLLESAYEECLCHELELQGIRFARQRHLPLEYKGMKLECGYRLDLVVEEKAILEIKSVEVLLPVHDAQLLTYLKLSGLTVGLLVNFHSPVLKSGVHRMVNNFHDER